ncbi:4Fe-4S binding protein [Candidatus Poribacteria bacterium]|nr:4Fe-4S binding protein [Candidatus Poribacteria bacterium]
MIYGYCKISGAVLLIICLLFAFAPNYAFSVQRFPPPQFKSGHVLPETTQAPPRSDFYEYLDAGVLLAALAVATYLALKRRSRTGLLILTIFSLAYFGFWRMGCVCAVGSVQNVTITLFQTGYSIPLVVVIFFALPLIFTLFFGRTFCAAVCPLGAIQDIFVIKPVRVPRWLDRGLRVIPYLYLGFAVLFAATGSAFIICEYDPFIAFFRRGGRAAILAFGGLLLILGMFVGRPYCRYLCPYGVVLSWMSKASKWHVSITPNECIQCRLCEDSCPFEAIDSPTEEKANTPRTEGKGRLITLIILLPLFIAMGVGLGAGVGSYLSRIDPDVRLAERIWLEDTGQIDEMDDASEAFRKTGRPSSELFAEAKQLRRQFRIGSMILGGFLGLFTGIKMISLSIKRSRKDYETNRTHCVSCGRCFSYCPVEKDEK